MRFFECAVSRRPTAVSISCNESRRQTFCERRPRGQTAHWAGNVFRPCVIDKSARFRARLHADLEAGRLDPCDSRIRQYACTFVGACNFSRGSRNRAGRCASFNRLQRPPPPGATCRTARRHCTARGSAIGATSRGNRFSHTELRKQFMRGKHSSNWRKLNTTLTIGRYAFRRSNRLRLPWEAPAAGTDHHLS